MPPEVHKHCHGWVEQHHHIPSHGEVKGHVNSASESHAKDTRTSTHGLHTVDWVPPRQLSSCGRTFLSGDLLSNFTPHLARIIFLQVWLLRVTLLKRSILALRYAFLYATLMRYFDVPLLPVTGLARILKIINATPSFRIRMPLR